MYLTAVIYLYSRFVVGWSLSNTMEAEWCQELIKTAIEIHGKPEILNTDQGAQYPSDIFSKYVKRFIKVSFVLLNHTVCIINFKFLFRIIVIWKLILRFF